MSEEHSGPYLQMALFCEKFLQEKDGVASVIRVIDRINAQGPAPEMLSITYPLILVITFKSGFMKCKANVKVRPVTPSNRALPEHVFPVLFESDERGPGIVINLNYTFSEEGLYWFDILVEDDLVTRIPMRVFYQQVAPTLPYASPGSGPSQ